MTRRVAIVTFNLGGPDGPDAVQPFLFNLFNDPAIIELPNPFRWLLARVISKRRAPVAREIYGHLGGGSPLLKLTQDQCRALEMAMETSDNATMFKCFIAMRYWHPMSLETAERVREFDPDEIVLLPLYPQYSSTTTGSSLKEWRRAADAAGLTAPTRAVCCYPVKEGWIEAQVDLVAKALTEWPDVESPRVLFSAHGLPKKVIDAGDPYQAQVEQTVAAVADGLAGRGFRSLDIVTCYQSRVGPLKWIGPATEDEVERAGAEGRGLIVVPIAFVSEHSETLVELDIEYRELADEKGVPRYARVPAVGDHPAFIAGLADMVWSLTLDGPAVCSSGGNRICASDRGRCPMPSAA
ncbi:MAG: ferrochelatase [Rhodospirillales bacterium]